MWLHRRSEEPSPTDIECYWRKSILSQVGSSIKFIMVKDFQSNKEVSTVTKNFNTLEEFVKRTQGKEVNAQILKYFNPIDFKRSLSIHHLLVDFITQGGTTCEEFVTFGKNRMYQNMCEEIEKFTQNQADCELWFTLRYGRITAFKAHDVIPDVILPDVIRLMEF